MSWITNFVFPKYNRCSVRASGAHDRQTPKLHIEGTLTSTDRRNEQILGFFPSIEELQTRIPRTRVTLVRDAIHVWRTALSAITPVWVLLRLIPASYCTCGPKDLCFTYDGFQKPGIEPNGHLLQIVAFNLSHSTDAIQIAIAAEGSIGIDVEHLGRKPNLDALLVGQDRNRCRFQPSKKISHRESRLGSRVGSSRHRTRSIDTTGEACGVHIRIQIHRSRIRTNSVRPATH